MTPSPPPPVILPGKISDLEALTELETIFPPSDRISRRSWHGFLAKPGCVWVCQTKGEPVGAAVLLFRKDTRAARLYSIAVHPGQTGKGYARALVKTCIAETIRRGCDRIRLEVRAGNARARGLYEQLGFEDTNLIPEYYSDGESAIRMEKRLNGTGAAA